MLRVFLELKWRHVDALSTDIFQGCTDDSNEFNEISMEYSEEHLQRIQSHSIIILQPLLNCVQTRIRWTQFVCQNLCLRHGVHVIMFQVRKSSGNHGPEGRERSVKLIYFKDLYLCGISPSWDSLNFLQDVFGIDVLN